MSSRDSASGARRLPSWPFVTAYSLPAIHLLGMHLRGPWLWVLPVYVFVGVPVFDRLIGDWRTEPEETGARRAIFDRLLELWLPMELCVLGWTLLQVTEQPLSAGEWLPFALSTGLVTGGGGITVAHELIHRPGRFHRALGEALMTVVLYAHWCVEHVVGHHRRVGTPEDAATARRGESIYSFLVRCIPAGFASAWRLEARRVEREPGFGWLADRRLRYPLTQLGLVAFVGLLLGPVALAAFLAQAVIAIWLLEVVNYVEHYGLVRELRPDGRPERVRPHHSWNSNAALSGAILFLVTRHSHHHAEASKPYDRLQAMPEAPMLPAGYPTMMLATHVPPLWFRWVDPLVDEVQSAA